MSSKDLSKVSSKIGKIKTVVCKDFLTYDGIKFNPCENLNIIIGANGTGKSTIVAAVVLGMGGHCKLLSRSPDICDFIQNGKEIAQIEIHIYKENNGSVIIFNRSFSKTSQVWEVDGTKVSQKEYIKQVRSFNIQIDNLCQFLPQDRVQDFAKLNSKELLQNTQLSVCSSEINEMLKNLISMRERQKNSLKDVSENITKLKELEDKVEQMKLILDAMDARNSLINDVKNCKRKKVWFEFNLLKEQCREVEVDVAQAKIALKENIDRLQPLAMKRHKLLKDKKQFDNRIRQEFDNTKQCSSELVVLEQKTERLEEMINDARDTLKGSIQSAKEHIMDVKNHECLLNACIQDLNDAVNKSLNEVDAEREIKKNNDEYSKYRKISDQLLDQRNLINSKLELDVKPEIVSVQKKIQQFENVSEIRLRTIDRYYNDTYRGIMWLREHQNEFNNKIYETALLEVNLKDAKYAKYFENSVGLRDLTCFICEDHNDSSKLANILREQLKLNLINVAANSKTQIYKPKIPLSEIRKYGFEAYLIDIIDGPLPVLNQLCNLYNIHNIPIGNDHTYDVSEEIPSEITQFFSTNHKFSVSTSRYTGNKSTRITEITPKNLMSFIDNTALQAEKLKLTNLIKKSDIIKNTRNEIENKIAGNTEKMNKYKEENNLLIKNKNYIESCKEKVRRQEQKVMNAKSHVIDIEEEKQKFKKNVSIIINNLLKLQNAKPEILEKYQKSCIKHEINKEKLSLFNKVNASIENEINEAETAVDKTKHLLDNINQTLLLRKDECKKKEKFARNLCDGLSPSDHNFPYKEIFKELPNTLDEIDTIMNEMQSRIECMGVAEVFDMEDYENKVKILEEMRSSVLNYNENSEQLEKSMQDIHEVWFPEISRIVKDINEFFSKFMSGMGYAGEVELMVSNERDYSDYGIEIRVKYRDREKIQTLDRYIQSGGERAVAIAVYTLSLQHITNVPFRCVDEINQGMDRHNERRVFEMIVKETCVEGKSQYFFITPKLLPNLVWNDLMTVHIIHNGTEIDID